MQTGTDADTLRVVESRGTYAGRKVTYIRVFDPASAAASGLVIQSFKDLDGPRSQVLRTGHIEQNGAVVLNRV